MNGSLQIDEIIKELPKLECNVSIEIRGDSIVLRPARSESTAIYTSSVSPQEPKQRGPISTTQMVNLTNSTPVSTRPALHIEEIRRELAQIESKMDEVRDIQELIEYPDQGDIKELDDALDKLHEKRIAIYQRLIEYARSLADE